MPVATQASLKGLTPDQLEDQGCSLCLNNTYHLYELASSKLLLPHSDIRRGLKPGQATLDAIGGAHKLQSWPHNILTGACPHTSLHALDGASEQRADCCR